MRDDLDCEDAGEFYRAKARNEMLCEDCGTPIINNCPRCGAPQCCPKCCAKNSQAVLFNDKIGIGPDHAQIVPILQQFAEARMHGQHKYHGFVDDPDDLRYGDQRKGDLLNELSDWIRFAIDHLERAKLGGDGTIDCRDHLIKAGGLILSAVWTQDIKSGREKLKAL